MPGQKNTSSAARTSSSPPVSPSSTQRSFGWENVRAVQNLNRAKGQQELRQRLQSRSPSLRTGNSPLTPESTPPVKLLAELPTAPPTSRRRLHQRMHRAAASQGNRGWYVDRHLDGACQIAIRSASLARATPMGQPRSTRSSARREPHLVPCKLRRQRMLMPRPATCPPYLCPTLLVQT